MAQVSVSHRSPGRWGSGGSPPPRVLSAPSGAGSGRRGRPAGAATVARGLGAQRTVWEQRGDSGTVPGKLGCQWELSAPRSRGSGQGPGDRSRLRPARRPGAAETPAPRPRRTSYPSPPSPSTQSQPGRASAASQRTLGSRGSLRCPRPSPAISRGCCVQTRAPRLGCSAIRTRARGFRPRAGRRGSAEAGSLEWGSRRGRGSLQQIPEPGGQGVPRPGRPGARRGSCRDRSASCARGVPGPGASVRVCARVCVRV